MVVLERHRTQLRKWQFKDCPRCNGDLFLDDEGYTCLQCGYIEWSFTPLPYVINTRPRSMEVITDERRNE